MRILLVEDDYLLASGLITALEREAFVIEHIADGMQALHALTENEFDLCILDLSLPGLDGMEVIERVRKLGKFLPILVLSARDGVSDRVKGLNRGADDYLVKPFDTEELIARIHVLERRKTGSSTNVISYKDLALDIGSMLVTYRGMAVELQPNEFKILKKLVEQPAVIFSKEQIEEYLYGWNGGVDSNTINVYIHGIRRKTSVDLIRTIRGIGYRIS
jgi:two-component system response regulator QseB